MAHDFFVGELSLNDVHVLTQVAHGRHRVLEFGAGGSTMLWAQFCPPCAEIVTVEPEIAWAQHTRAALARLGVPDGRVRFVSDTEWRGAVGERPWFDAVFCDSGDGAARSRMGFAEDAWPLLQPGGLLVVHDTHTRAGHELLSWLPPRLLELDTVEVNKHSSATSIVRKRSRHFVGATHPFEELEDWHGHGPLPAGWPPRRG